MTLLTLACPTSISISESTCPLCVAVPSYDLSTVILATPQWQVIWANDPNYPCFIRVIWQAHIAEMTDLLPPDRAELMRVVYAIEQALRCTLKPAPHKINLASLGNYVPHLHWHVIARHMNDAHWPDATFSQPHRLANAPLNTIWASQRAAVAAAIVENLCLC